jgi:ribokinase
MVTFATTTGQHSGARTRYIVDAVDTTAAGDTFVGYFLAGLMETVKPDEALANGCRAAALCVTKAGASDSIPLRGELEKIKPSK